MSNQRLQNTLDIKWILMGPSLYSEIAIHSWYRCLNGSNCFKHNPRFLECSRAKRKITFQLPCPSVIHFVHFRLLEEIFEGNCKTQLHFCFRNNGFERAYSNLRRQRDIYCMYPGYCVEISNGRTWFHIYDLQIEEIIFKYRGLFSL